MKTFLTFAGVLVSFAAWALVWRDTARSKQARPWYVRHPLGWLKGLGVATMGLFALMAFNWDEIQAQERAKKKAAIAAAGFAGRTANRPAAAPPPVTAPLATVAEQPDYERSRDVPAVDAPPKAAAPTVRAPGETEAWVMAKGFVKNALRSPSTADFGGIFDQSPNCNSAASAWKCVGWVDAQNGFGATVRSYFSVTIKWISAGDWADPRSWDVVDGPTIIAR